jgi:hypothetical protein
MRAAHVSFTTTPESTDISFPLTEHCSKDVLKHAHSFQPDTPQSVVFIPSGSILGSDTAPPPIPLFTVAAQTNPQLTKPISKMSRAEFLEFCKIRPSIAAIHPTFVHLRNDLLELLCEFQDIFALATEDIRTPSSLEPFSIKTVPLNTSIRPPYRTRFSAKEQDAINAQVDIWLKNGIIEPSSSLHINSLLTVPKPDGSSRVCIDPRILNSATYPDLAIIPAVQEVLDSLFGSSIFSSLDLFQGYLQIPLEPASRPLTTFTTPAGVFQFTRLPFGLKNACAAFNTRLRNLERRHGLSAFVGGYFDDLTPHSATPEQHMLHLRKVFTVLRNSGLKLNVNKCNFFLTELKLLGHVVSAKGVSVDPAKIAALQSLPPPSSLKELQHMLGLGNYYRKFVPDFAAITRPLTALTGANTPWVWSAECQTAWQTLCASLTSPPVLALPDPRQPFILHTDASNCTIAAVLSQHVDKSSKDPRPIAFISRQLSPTEMRYSTTEKELLAILFACKKLRTYLFGQQCTVYTDHAALTYLLGSNDLSGRLVRWSLYLQQFDLTMLHRPGKANGNADALSRLPSAPPTADDLDVAPLPCFCLSIPTEKSLVPSSCFVVTRSSDSLQPSPQSLPIIMDTINANATQQTMSNPEVQSLPVSSELLDSKTPPSSEPLITPIIGHPDDISSPTPNAPPPASFLSW